MRFAVVAHRRSETNLALAAAPVLGVDSSLLTPREALLRLGRGDVALARLDVRDELDGIEDGLPELERLRAAGVAVLNPPSALLAAHDKLLTARALRQAGLPHPRTVLIDTASPAPALEFPLVLKPRYGSWGRDVTLCPDGGAFRRELARLETQPWFRSGGAVVQELVPPLGHDLRLLVAAGRVVGAIRRDAPPGEWRTNVTLGATRSPVEPSAEARKLAEAAARAIGADLVGVDLLPAGVGRHTIVEMNGAVDFTVGYARDVYRSAALALICSTFELRAEPVAAGLLDA
jgi:[lysine-biosynthesis-protein LysW]--L-2-aminoadipate ligase